MEINREELAWAAGFWDGEGCTTPQRVKGNSYVHLTVHQVFKPNLDRFHRAIGGLGNVTGPARKNSAWQPIWGWQTSKFEHAQAVIGMLWTFLSQEKRDQYLRVLAKAKENPHFALTYREKQKQRSLNQWKLEKAFGINRMSSGRNEKGQYK